MSRRILEEEPVPLSKVKELLDLREEDAPLNYIQRVALDHANRFSKNLTTYENLLKRLQEEFELSEIVSIQLVNLIPSIIADVKAILGDSVPEETQEKILKVCLEHQDLDDKASEEE